MHGHPRIDNDSIRVRLIDFGGSSLDIEIRVYARTREWNDFYAIREDLLLRIKDIVETSGTGFAFSSQTLYLGKDEGLDEELSQKSEEAVARWRIGKKLPFPHFSADITEQLNDKLDYPPRGSSEYNLENEEDTEHREELLSAAPVDEQDNESDEKKRDS